MDAEEHKLEIKWRVKEIKGLPVAEFIGETENYDIPETIIKNVLIANALIVLKEAQMFKGIAIQAYNSNERQTRQFSCRFAVLFKDRRSLRNFIRHF